MKRRGGTLKPSTVPTPRLLSPLRARELALASVAIGLLLPGCPLTDSYYIEHAATGGAPIPNGASATGGVFNSAGDGDGVGADSTGDSAGANATGGTGAGPGDATGGDTSVGGGGGVTASGGSGGTGGDIAGSGGLTTGGTDGGGTGGGGSGGTAGDAGGTAAGSGGVTAGTGGASAGGGGRWSRGTGGTSAGRTSAGAGGMVAIGGNGTSGAPAAGTTGSAGTSSSNQFRPLCDDSIVKNAPCDASSVQFCYRTCGPDGIGYKSETCESGSYNEQMGCTFPTGQDYSCYSIPYRLPSECPAATPRATQSCQISACTVCFGGSVSNPLYEDSTGAQKGGYCVCSGGDWTCGSTTAWPCPDGTGCN
jgi:hypothetical protein